MNALIMDPSSSASCNVVGGRPLSSGWGASSLPPRRGRHTAISRAPYFPRFPHPLSFPASAATSAVSCRSGVVDNGDRYNPLTSSSVSAPGPCCTGHRVAPGTCLGALGSSRLCGGDPLRWLRRDAAVLVARASLGDDGGADTVPLNQLQQQVPLTRETVCQDGAAAAKLPAKAMAADSSPIAAHEPAATDAAAAQSEYVEEYETVYETETEQQHASRTAAAEAAPAATAAAGGEEEAIAIGVGSTTAEVVTAGSDAALLHQAAVATVVQAVLPPPQPLASRPHGNLLSGSSDGGFFLGGTPVSGWALAAALLLAIRMSRQEADRERVDLQALQARQAEGRQLDSVMRARRRAFLEEERRRLEEEAAKRVAEAKARQEAEARAAAERQRQWQEEAAREAQRMQEAAAAARRVYEEREARLADELVARAEVERRLREEAEARRREEEAEQRRAEAEAAQKAAEARAAAAAAEAARRAAEAAARREAERRLRLASTWYTFGFRGRVSGRPAPPGTVSPISSGGGAGQAAAALLRGPPVARIVVECSVELSYAARTAPTLTGTSAVIDVNATVEAAAAEGAASVVTLTLPASDLYTPSAAVSTGGIGIVAGAVTAVAASPMGTSRRPYESAAAAVEGAAELAGAAAAPLAALLSSQTWLGALPLQPSPAEGLAHWLGTDAEAADGKQAAAETAETGLGVEEGHGAATSRVTAAAGAAAPAPSGRGGAVGAAAASAAATSAAAAAAPAGLEALTAQELRHWARIAHLQVLCSCRQLVCQLAPLLGPGEHLEQEFQCCISRQVPPPAADLPVAAAAAAAVLPPPVAPSLCRAAAAAAAGRLQVAVDVLNNIIAREEDAAVAGRGGAANGAALPPLAVAALLYSELMEAAGYEPPPPPAGATAGVAAADGLWDAEARAGVTMAAEEGTGEGAAGVSAPTAGPASAVGASLERLTRYQLTERARGAPPDSLLATSQLLRLVLPGGPRHPISRLLDSLAEANLSAVARQALQIRRQRAALEAQAAAVLQQQRGSGGVEGPAWAGTGGELVVGPGGAADARGSLVPVPEWLWASRNVANNLLRFGEPMAVGEAVGMLGEAVSVARRHYGERHPAQLAVLLDYLDALAAEQAARGGELGAAGAAPSSSSAAARRGRAAEELLEVVQVLCERYQTGRDPLSCVLLLEAALVEVGPVLRPVRRSAGGRGDGGGSGSGRGPSAALAASTELAGEMMFSLKPPEARTVMTARRDGELAGLLRRLARDFTEDLAAHGKKKNRWLETFNKGDPLPPLRP